MNTTTISAVLPNAPSGTDRNRSSGTAEGGSFSNVLDSQQSALTPPVPSSTRDAEPARGRNDDAELAKNAAEHGLPGGPAPVHEPAHTAAGTESGEPASRTLPQIALQLAAEIAAVRQAVSGRGTVESKADTAPALTSRAGDLTARNATDRRPAASDARDSRAATGLENTSNRLGLDTAVRQAFEPALVGLPASVASPAGRLADDTTLAPRGSLLGPARAASIAGAKQAVLTMQARAQATDTAPGTVVQQALGLAGMGFDDSLAQVLADLPGDHGRQADISLTDPQAIPVAAGLNGASSATLAALTQPVSANAAIATPLNSPQWGADFSRQFISLAQGGQNAPHTAELRLDPPELGPLRISINISDNVAHAVFVSPHASVRQTVENSLSQLQQALAQAGISLGEANVSDQGQQAEQAFNERFGTGSARAGAGFTLNGGEAMDAAAAPVARRAVAPDALVDTFA